MPQDHELSPFGERLGYEMLEHREGFCRMALDAQDWQANRAGMVHGGVIAALIDSCGGYAGAYCTVPGNIRRAVTVTMTIHYARPAPFGRLTATGKLKGGGRQIFFTTTDVHDPEGRLIAFGEGTYRLRRGSEKPEGVPPDFYARYG